MAEPTHPIEGQIVLLAGAHASVTLDRLAELTERAHRYVRTHRVEYDREYERIDGSDGLVYYLVDPGHWNAVGATLGIDDRESDALRRVHAEQFRRDGRRLERLAEFETAMDIREVVVADGHPGQLPV
jgi:hypothetical protein